MYVCVYIYTVPHYRAFRSVTRKQLSVALGSRPVAATRWALRRLEKAAAPPPPCNEGISGPLQTQRLRAGSTVGGHTNNYLYQTGAIVSYAWNIPQNHVGFVSGLYFR